MARPFMTVASMPMKSPLTRSMPRRHACQPPENVAAANDHGGAGSCRQTSAMSAAMASSVAMSMP